MPNLEDFWRYRFQVTAKVGNWTNTSDKTAVITTLAGSKFVFVAEDIALISMMQIYQVSLIQNFIHMF